MNWKDIGKDILSLGKFFAPPVVLSWVLTGRSILGRTVSVNMALIVTLGFLIVWLTLLLVKWAQAPRPPGEPDFDPETEKPKGRPHKQSLTPSESLIEMRGKLSDTIALVEKADRRKTGRRPLRRLGPSAMYRLPWYLVLGPTDCGKTSLLKGSDVLVDSPAWVVPEGPTHNCDWFFAGEAIFMDTTGRYVSEDDATSNQEWQGLLDLLKTHRKRKPLDGIIVTIDAGELLLGTIEENEQAAQKIRRRINELIKRLGINFPVYLVFTKCDRIRGFTAFFDDFTPEHRVQVWGSTFARQRENPEAAFEEACEKLHQSLRDMTLDRLASAETDTEKKRDIFVFPMAFHAAFRKISGFVEVLFRDAAFDVEKPMFRGFYFTSSTQTGDSIDLVFRQMAEEIGIRPAIPRESPGDTKRYFIKDLFAKIFFHDGGLARRTERAEHLLGRRRVVLSSIVFSGIAALMILFGVIIPGVMEPEPVRVIIWSNLRNGPIQDVLVDGEAITDDFVIEKKTNQWTIRRIPGKYTFNVRTSTGYLYQRQWIEITYDGQPVRFE